MSVSYWYDHKSGCVWFEQERNFSDAPSYTHKELVRIAPSTIVRMTEEMWQGAYRTEIVFVWQDKPVKQVVYARLDDVALALKPWLRPRRKHRIEEKKP